MSVDGTERLFISDAGTDLQGSVRLAQLPQFGNIAEVDHGRQAAVQLGHPEPDIRAAGEKDGVGVSGVNLRQFVDAGRGKVLSTLIL